MARFGRLRAAGQRRRVNRRRLSVGSPCGTDEHRACGNRKPSSYDSVLHGGHITVRDSEDETDKAIALFEQAFALDPDYGRAHAAVAAASWRIVQSTWESTTEWIPCAFDRMQSLSPSDATTHCAGSRRVGQSSSRGCTRRPSPRLATPWRLPRTIPTVTSKARILNATGRAAEAEVSVRWPMRLDPLSSPDHLRALAISLFHQQRYEEAVEHPRETPRHCNPRSRRLHHTDCQPWTSWTQEWRPRGNQDVQ